MTLLFNQYLHLITGMRNNMKNVLMTMTEKTNQALSRISPSNSLGLRHYNTPMSRIEQTVYVS